MKFAIGPKHLWPEVDAARRPGARDLGLRTSVGVTDLVTSCLK